VNVLIFSHTSQLGGAERSLLQLIRELTLDYETKCTVVLPNHGPLCKFLEDVGSSNIIGPLNWWCTVGDLPVPDEVSRQYNESSNWLKYSIPSFKTINLDVVLTNTLVIPWGAITALSLSLPHIWMVNEFGVLDHGLEFFLPSNDVLEFIEKTSDKIVTRSNAIKNELFPNLEKSKIRTIYRDIEITDNYNLSTNSIKNFFKRANAFRLTILATLREEKGQEDAVRSVIELVKNRNRNIELVIAGKDHNNYLHCLQEIITESNLYDFIHIVPFQENTYPILEQTHVILNCSRMEAFGRSILEGMMMGKAIIATNTGGNPEMITNGETGLLYSPGNYLDLADQVENLIDNPELMGQLAHNGYQFAKKNFTKEKYGGKYNRLLNEIITKPQNNNNKNMGELTLKYLNLMTQLNCENVNLKKTLDNTENEVLYYSLSKSWRITRPIRKIMKVLRGR